MTRIRFDLRTRTILLATGVALVPFALLALAALTLLRGSLLAKAESDHRGIAAQVVKLVEHDLGNLRDQIRMLSMDHRIQGLKEPGLHDALHNFLAFNQDFLSIYVYDRKHTLRAIEYRNHYTGANQQIGTRSQNARLTASLEQVMTGIEPAAVDNLRPDRTQSQLLLLQPVPAFTGVGPAVGALSVALLMYSHEFRDFLDPVSLEGSTYCLILDRKGRVLARKGTGVPEGVAAVELPSEALTGQSVTTKKMDIVGRVERVSFAPLPWVGAILMVSRPDGEVMALLDQLTARILGFAVLGLLLAIVCSLWMASSLVRPILALTEGIRKVGQGAIGHRVQIEREDELGQAADAFNYMASQLQKGKLMEQVWSRVWEEGKDERR